MRKLNFTLYLCLIGCLSYAQTASQGFFLDGWKAKNIVNPTTSAQTPIPISPVTSTVTIDAANVITKVPKQIYGHNAAVWGGKINLNVPIMNDIKNLSPNVIRWPGGNMSNDYFWNASSQATCPKDIPPATTATSALPPSTFKFNPQLYGADQTSFTMPLNNYYDMLIKTNSTGIICVNYAYARYGTSADPVLTAAKYAADWVRFDNGRTKYWEIGNENYGSWETGYDIDQSLNKDGQPKRISGDLYGKHAAVFIREMKKAALEIGSDIKIGVVLFHNQYDQTGAVLGVWNKGVIPNIVNKADYLILHNYYTSRTDEGINTILTSALTIPEKLMKVGLDDLKMYGNGVTTMPIALTEWNIVAEGRKQQVSYINGVHAALNLGELIENKWGLSNRWDFLNSWKKPDGSAVLDNHGLFAHGEPDVDLYSPRAPFYYMYYFQKIFGDKMVASTVTGNPDVKSYASTFSSGQSGVVLINTGGNSQTVDLKMNNFTLGTKYHYYMLTGGTDVEFSRNVIVNGNGPAPRSVGPLNYDALQAYATNIVGSSMKINLPKYGVAYVLVENSVLTTAPEINIKQGANTILNTSGKYNFVSNVAVGNTSAPITFTIQNTGTATLNVGAITMTGTNPAQFGLTQVVNPTIANPLGSSTFTLKFKPTSTGAKTAIVSIANNDPNESPFTFTVNANASIATNIEEVQTGSESLVIFPNPSNDGIFELSKVANWKVTSVLGEELMNGSGDNINISGYPKGIYLIKINDKIERVVVE